MPAKAESVLIVDDSPDDARFLMENLKQDYAVRVAKDGASALEKAAADDPPKIILLDVSMPEMDGYETCQKLKQNPATANIDVIFVTAHDSLDEKLKGYDVGGSDYLIKPIMPDELKQKVNLLIQNQHSRQKRSLEAQHARDVAMTAMMDAGELSVIMEFMRKSFSTTSSEDLASLIVKSLLRYDLHSSVQIRTPWAIIDRGINDPVPPLESELMLRLKDSGRIQTMAPRMILNSDHITILVKNLPADDHKAGRLRDHLAHVIEGAEARYRALIVKEELRALVGDSMGTLARIQNLLQQQKAGFVKIMDKVREDVQASFMSYGLTEEQEKLLIDIVECAEEETLQNFEQGLKVDEEFLNIITRLKQFG